MTTIKLKNNFLLSLFLVVFLCFNLSCSEVEKQLNETQSLNTTCPITKSKSHYLLSNTRNIPEAKKLIDNESSLGQYKNQILNFALSQLYFSPHSTNLNSHTLLFAKVNGKEIFINSIPQSTFQFSFIDGLNELAKKLGKPLAIKSRLKLVESKINQYIYASKSLEEFIKNNQSKLFQSKELKKVYFRGAQGIRENELFQRLSYLSDFKRLKAKARPSKGEASYISNHLFASGGYECSFDSKIYDAEILVLKKPVKSYQNIFSHYRDKNNYIIGVTSSVSGINNSVNEFLFQNTDNDSYTAACMTKDPHRNRTFLMMNGITYNAQVLNSLIKNHPGLSSPQEYMNTKRSLMLSNPKRTISEIYGINKKEHRKSAQYYVPSIGQLTILELNDFLSSYTDPRNRQLKCN